MLLSMDALPEKFDYCINLGYEAIDLNFCRVIYDLQKDGYAHDPILDGDNWKNNLDVYKEKALKHNIKINTTHLPYRFDYADFQNPDYEYKFQMTCRALEASEYVGAKWAVVHIHIDGVEKTVAHVKKLYASSSVKNIGIAIENMINMPVEPVMEAYEILKAEGYNVGICLDTGHCNIGTDDSFNMADVVRKLGSAIKMLHVHDNSKNGDFHREPYAGTINWADFMKALKEVGYEGDFNFEFNLARLPKEIAEDYDKYCVKLGKYLISLY